MLAGSKAPTACLSTKLLCWSFALPGLSEVLVGAAGPEGVARGCCRLGARLALTEATGRGCRKLDARLALIATPASIAVGTPAEVVLNAVLRASLLLQKGLSAAVRH